VNLPRQVPALALAGVILLAGCGEEPPVATTQTVGPGSRQIQVLVEQGAEAALRGDIRQYVTSRKVAVSWGGGTAEAIATTVKHGYRIDVVVLPSGPALERVDDELLAPPAKLGTLRSTTYWACAVDQSGLSFVRFLTGRTGKGALRQQGFDVSS
jgi:ABC-type molybdate transport system substrate-binding protein